MAWKSLDEMNLEGRRVLTRVDLNVPMEEGRVTDTTRIDRIVPTVRDILEAGGRPVLLAHFGRPKGKVVPEMSLRHIVPALEDALGHKVVFAGDCIGHQAKEVIDGLEDGEVALLENTRFRPEEEANDPDFARKIAANGDVYCNDAFSAAHRAHASTEGIAHLLPACAGRLMAEELEALERALGSPQRPVVAIVGGAKVSTKLDLLANLVTKVDTLVIGGGMANTFLASQGYGVGKSLCEHDLTGTAQEIGEKAVAAGCTILLPRDVVVAKKLEKDAESRVCRAEEVGEDEMILDAGPDSVAHIAQVLDGAKTLVWNGPLGAFEIPPFDRATVEAARHAAELTLQDGLVSVAGGGDTVSALNQAGVAMSFTYVSSAGGAFLEWMEGKDLPGVAALG